MGEVMSQEEIDKVLKEQSEKFDCGENILEMQEEFKNKYSELMDEKKYREYIKLK